MSYMTKIEGVADTDDLRPGMAFFAGTGPAGKACADCKHRGYMRESRSGKWNEGLQQIVHRAYRVTKCAMFKKMSGHHGADVALDNPACKYFEPKDQPVPSAHQLPQGE